MSKNKYSKCLIGIITVVLLILLWFYWQSKQADPDILSEHEFNRFWETRNNLPEKKVSSLENNPLENKTIYQWNGINQVFELTQTYLGREIDTGQYRLIKEVNIDVDGNGLDENYLLTNGQIVVSEGGETIWQSEADWWVDDFALADSTGNGSLYLNLSVWKAGNYGPSQPFWVKDNDPAVKNHFFVFGFRDGSIQPIWQSSSLAMPNCQFQLADVDRNGQQELVVLEGEYRDDWNCQANYLAVWRWKEWGFYNEWRSSAGFFANLKIVEENDLFKIAVDQQ